MSNTSMNKKTGHFVRIIRLSKHINFNIGTFIFGALLVYMSVSFILYLTAGHVTSYQVVSGPLEKNQTYTAIALRKEQIFHTDAPGFVNYYARENSRIKKNGLIYTLSNEQVAEEGIQLDSSSLAKIRSSIAKFSNSFTGNHFNQTYNFKYELESNILQFSGWNCGLLGENGDITLSDNQTGYYAPQEGIILYTTDGYETKQPEQVTSRDFNQRVYHKESLKNSNSVAAGSNVYKIIPDENWSLIIPLTDEQMAQLAARTSIRVKFLKDGSSQVGNFSILFQNNEKFGKIDFENGLLRYVADRYIDIELVTNTKSGLKIPVSSIVKKDFYTIPESYLTTGGNNNEEGFIRERTDKNGKVKTEFVASLIYLKDDGMCYVDSAEFTLNDRIKNGTTNDRHTIKEKQTLQGVFSINKGYAIFRHVVIIDQDEEYCIVEKGQDYSIAQFDHIVLNGDSVKEKEILY